MSCCAIGKCGRTGLAFAEPGLVYDAESRTWTCYLCYVMPRLFPDQPSVKQQQQAEAAILEERTENPGRAGAPKLAAERERPTSRKSNRAGPNWVPHNRRV